MVCLVQCTIYIYSSRILVHHCYSLRAYHTSNLLHLFRACRVIDGSMLWWSHYRHHVCLLQCASRLNQLLVVCAVHARSPHGTFYLHTPNLLSLTLNQWEWCAPSLQHLERCCLHTCTCLSRRRGSTPHTLACLHGHMHNSSILFHCNVLLAEHFIPILFRPIWWLTNSTIPIPGCYAV